MDYGWQTVQGNTPSKSNAYKIITIGGHSSLAKTKALKDYENAFFMQCGKYRNLKIDKFFEYHCKVFYPSMRSDIDNSLKVQLDCLQKTKTITNDNKCVKVVAEKFIDKENPRVEFRIVTID
jgi:Holliday junction resolvase RusA-like endonuclease